MSYQWSVCEELSGDDNSETYLKTIIVDENTGGSTIQFVVTDGFLQTVDGRHNDTCQRFLVDRHLNGNVRTREPGCACSLNIWSNCGVTARIGDDSSDWSQKLEEIGEDDDDEKLI